ncbi:MAG: hypothetical protein RRY40_01545 [Oscillospiraceae bacterium]
MKKLFAAIFSTCLIFVAAAGVGATSPSVDNGGSLGTKTYSYSNSCPNRRVCPNPEICPNNGACPNNAECPNLESCPNGGVPKRDGTGYKGNGGKGHHNNNGGCRF